MTLTEHAGQYNDDPESYIRQRIADLTGRLDALRGYL
jgi:hypothetical protein